jgi:N-acetylglucosaminyldiphosphoundecaprenol N-acetyl-beta-D-mannosaminyltransferase
VRILCVQWADIGDVVLTTPALSALREVHPDAHIGLLTTPAAATVVRGTGLVDSIYTLPRFTIARRETLTVFNAIRRDRYDAVLYFHRLTTRAGAWKYAALGYFSGAKRRVGLDNGRGRFLTHRAPDPGFDAEHQTDAWLKVAALLGANPAPRPLAVAREPFPLPDAPKRIAVHAGSGGFSTARRWSPEQLASATDTLASELGAQIVVVGTSDDDTPELLRHLKSPALDLTGKTTVSQLADVLGQCDLYLGSDSGVTHVSAASGTPTVAVFGPTNDRAYRPLGNSVVVRTLPECAPCMYVGHEMGSRDGCPPVTCLTMVTSEIVIRAARKLLSSQLPAASDQLTNRRDSMNSVHDAITRDSNSALSPQPSALILGIPVHGMTYAQLLDQIGAWIKADDGAHHVNTINPEFMVVAQKDGVFRALLRRADLNVPDGVGLLWAARHLGHPMPERITGSDGLPIIAERAAREGWSLYMLGAGPGVADKAAAALTSRFPGLKIVGTYEGSPRGEEEAAIVERVNASGADILFMAYGTPAQEKWIARNLPRLKVNVAIGVGGAFDFAAGTVPRAPVWMQNAGIEWLYRLYLQPWRIKRMTRLPRFVIAVLRRGSKGAWEPYGLG